MTWQQLVEGAASVGILPKYPKPGRARTIPTKVAHRMLRSAFNVIAEEVLHGRRVAIPGFGVFTKRTRKARRIRNPQTRELMELGESTTIGFRCSKTIKR